MTMMKDDTLLALVMAGDGDAETYATELKVENDFISDFYDGSPWNEVEGHSTVISTDVQDVVEADMPSHIRVFLGSKDIIKFEANTAEPLDIQEAEEKTAYCNWVIRHQPNSFRLIHDWIKTAEIKKFAALRYDWVEEKKVLKKTYSGLDDAEHISILNQFIEEDKRKDTDIDITKDEQDDDGWMVEAIIKTTVKRVKIISIPTDNFVISRNAKDKDDAEIIGDNTLVSRGELIATGFNESDVMGLPTSSQDRSSNKQGSSRENQKQTSDIQDPASELVVVRTRIVKLDRDGDGIAERLKVIYSSATLLSVEPFDHVNYAVFSTILMPNEAIGKSRGEITTKNQEVKTVLIRGMLDNSYRVNSGRVVINTTNTNIDDVLTQRRSGVIRTKGDVRQAVAQLETPFTADKMLMVIQYMDQTRAQRTGTLLASQGLTADQVNDETAARFNGVQAEGTAKVELVARVLAETGFTDLFTGIAWTVAHFQDDKTEINVLGKPLTIDPGKWRFDHYTTPLVGLGSGDDDQLISNMSGIMAIQQQLIATQSPLVDSKKLYNTLDKMVKALGQRRTDEFFNNPEIPQQLQQGQIETLSAQLDQAMNAVEQLQKQNDPLANAERIRAEAKLQEVAIKETAVQQQKQIDMAKLAENQRQFDATLIQEQKEMIAKLEQGYVKLEVENQTDIPGKGLENE